MNDIYFSVIIPTYNRADFISDTINSVLNQTHQNFELIIIDDGSTDNTNIIIKNFQQTDNRIKYFYQENKGRCIARNKGIKEAKAQWICFLDSDDIFLDNHLHIFANLINKYPFHYAFATEQVIGNNVKKYNKRKFKKSTCKIQFKDFLFSNPISPIQFCYNKTKIKTLFADENIPISEDWLFFRNLTLKHDILKVNTITNVVTEHNNRTINSIDIHDFIKWNIYTANLFIKNNQIDLNTKKTILSHTYLLATNVLLNKRLKHEALIHFKKSLLILQSFKNSLFYKAIIRFLI
jgi:glycosyltransferase involved in cell wall biosynthesis